MARPAWSGFLRLSLVSVPVQAYAADKPNDGKAVFNQLHAACHSRIKYKKVCPIHGEVGNDEIVSAYQYENGRYIVLDDDEINDLKSTADKAHGIGIQSFIPPEAVDPFLFDGRNYYLLPDGAAGEQPYALLCKAMQEEHRCGLAEAVLWGRKRLVLIRPTEKLLTMSLLQYTSQLKDSEEFADRAPAVKTRADELRLARRLIGETSEDSVDWSKFLDDYAGSCRLSSKPKRPGNRWWRRKLRKKRRSLT